MENQISKSAKKLNGKELRNALPPECLENCRFWWLIW